MTLIIDRDRLVDVLLLGRKSDLLYGPADTSLDEQEYCEVLGSYLRSAIGLLEEVGVTLTEQEKISMLTLVCPYCEDVYSVLAEVIGFNGDWSVVFRAIMAEAPNGPRTQEDAFEDDFLEQFFARFAEAHNISVDVTWPEIRAYVAYTCHRDAEGLGIDENNPYYNDQICSWGWPEDDWELTREVMEEYPKPPKER